MRIVHESIFSSALRAFFVTLFGIIGLMLGVALICGAIYGIASLSEEDGLSSDIKILADANGKRKELSSDSPVILQISFEGEIGSDALTWKKIERQLLKSRDDEFKHDRVKGIFLHINSPGGGVIDSDVIYRELEEYKKRYNVPIFAFIDGICASGGYYIASVADKIYASDVSIIGSVGVLAWPPFVNISSILEKFGVESLTLYAGKGKDELNPLRPWKPGEQESYQKLINYYYDRFVQVVLERRPNLNEEKLVKTYGADVFPAPHAADLGYIDSSGYTRSKALKELALASGIKEDAPYQVISFESKTWWKELFKERPFFLSEKIKHEWVLPKELKRDASQFLQYRFIP
jgi:protease-4